MNVVIGTKVNEQELLEAGYTKKSVKAWWKDVGSAESGPKLIGHPDHDEWTKYAHTVFVEDGVIVAEDYEDPGAFSDVPF
ncbi:hypothetical protein FDI24_gp050 [Acidovorax phage ACP17]|uniref:Uncharacterized protein n=1 Tax=Acidovorax phage ACP17 TaxID=2010329 RepID=A0A223AIY8_9CAUD|nr:hypothetical protein FDI24_gp050 [Acidovorax phage ACP17]ASS33918.1 hypothetical protein [Acidovorax phage ACP17]